MIVGLVVTTSFKGLIRDYLWSENLLIPRVFYHTFWSISAYLHSYLGMGRCQGHGMVDVCGTLYAIFMLASESFQHTAMLRIIGISVFISRLLGLL